MTVYPVAVVRERRGTYGQVTVVEVECPHGRHLHSVGVTGGAATVQCTHTGRVYTVLAPVAEGDTSGGDATSTT